MKNIIELYKNNIQTIIKNFTGQKNEDIAQEVYIKAWKGLDKYKENGRFKSWISTITANTCRDYLKANSAKQNKTSYIDESTIMQISDHRIMPEDQLLYKERQEQILKAINCLKPKQKEVIVLYEIKNMNYDEISKIIKKPIGTVKSRLFNARKELAEILENLI